MAHEMPLLYNRMHVADDVLCEYSSRVLRLYCECSVEAGSLTRFQPCVLPALNLVDGFDAGAGFKAGSWLLNR